MMRHAKSSVVLAWLALLLVVSSVHAQPASSAAPTTVVVTFSHPERFSEMRFAPASQRSDIKDDLALLKTYINKRAERILAPGQQLSIDVTDVAFAGNFEPWTGAPGGWMRVIRNTYPPRLDLHFTLRDANGRVLKEASRKLTNPGFMDGASTHASDPLRYEKALVDRWLRHGTIGM